MQEMPTGGPSPEMGPGEEPSSPDHLTRKYVTSQIENSEWHGSDRTAQDRYLQDLEVGGVFDETKREDYERKIANQSGTSDKEDVRFSQVAMEVARENADKGRPENAAMCLFYAKHEALSAPATTLLREKARIMVRAHDKKAAIVKEHEPKGEREVKAQQGTIKLSQEAVKIYRRAATQN